jgi:hypothetical protein
VTGLPDRSLLPVVSMPKPLAAEALARDAVRPEDRRATSGGAGGARFRVVFLPYRLDLGWVERVTAGAFVVGAFRLVV